SWLALSLSLILASLPIMKVKSLPLLARTRVFLSAVTLLILPLASAPKAGPAITTTAITTNRAANHLDRCFMSLPPQYPYGVCGSHREAQPPTIPAYPFEQGARGGSP